MYIVYRLAIYQQGAFKLVYEQRHLISDQCQLTLDLELFCMRGHGIVFFKRETQPQTIAETSTQNVRKTSRFNFAWETMLNWLTFKM